MYSESSAAGNRNLAIRPVLTFLSCCLLTGTALVAQKKLLTADDLASFPQPEAVERIPYGRDPLQFGELRIPEGAGPHPTAIVIHGGCWLSAYDVQHIRPLAASLTANGIATWTIEYRRVGNSGGGWPGTFSDVARATDHLRELAGEYPLDLKRVIAVGHSAGGHLALWLVARKKLSPASELFEADPLELAGILGLAPAPNLIDLWSRKVCGHVIDGLMGGSPSAFPQRYHDGSPGQLLPLATPQVLIGGAFDSNWYLAGRSYFEAAQSSGDPIQWIEAAESGHFEMIDPRSRTWPLVLESVKSLFESD